MTRGSIAKNGRAEGAGLQSALILALAAIITAAGLGTLREVLSLWDLGQSANPYWLPDHALALYFITPLTALATSLFFLAPGLILSAAFGREKSAALWLLSGFGSAIVVLVAATTAFQLATGIVLTGMGFFYLVLALNIGALAIAGFRQASGQPMRVQLAGQGGDLLMAAVVFWAALVLMAPHFYWQSFSADGVDSLKVTRQYIQSLWPFWPPEAGVIQSSPSLTSVLFVFPSSWFLRLWGPVEFALRVPMLMGLSLLYPMLTALIRAARPSAQIGLLPHVLIAATLCLYTLSVAYSGGYHPWFGDSAMPGTRETLAMVCFMGYILAFVQERRVLVVGAALMSYLSIPTGGLWLLAWPLAVLLVWRPLARGRLIFSFWVLIGAGTVAVLLPVLVGLLGLPFPGGEFSASAVVQRLRFVAFTDWNRIAFLAVPIGIMPVLAIATWRWQDQISKALILLSIGFFIFFYLQGYRILLHHFIPAMFPLLVAMWRSPLVSHGVAKGAVCLGLLAGLWLALPKDASVQGYDREFGGFIATEGPRFVHGDPQAGAGSYGYDPRAVDTADVLLTKLFPIGLTDSAPAESFFGAPLAWWHYSEFPKSADQAINYVIKPVTAATSTDGALFATHDGYGLYIRDMALFEKHKLMRLPYDNGAPILATKRSVIFGGGAKWAQSWSDRHVIDLVAIAKKLLGVN